MKQQKKMQSNLSKESLRKDNGHFLEITQGPFQRKALLLSVLYWWKSNNMWYQGAEAHKILAIF